MQTTQGNDNSGEIVTKGEFAVLAGVSPGRVSQWISERKIHSEALVGEGRRARIHAPVALDQLRRNLNLAQRLGANGSATRLDCLPQAVGTPSEAASTIDDQIKTARLQQLELQNERSREERAARAGLYVRAEEARLEIGRIGSRMMILFEAAIAEFANVTGSKSNLPARDALHLFRSTFRSVRERQSAVEAQTVAGLSPLIEDQEIDQVNPEGQS